jgi:hypothetical protein
MAPKRRAKIVRSEPDHPLSEFPAVRFNGWHWRISVLGQDLWHNGNASWVHQIAPSLNPGDEPSPV